MSKEDFRKNIMEEQIFHELKDCEMKNSNYLRRKYQGLDIDYSRLYRRIVNYQIKTYGRSLNEGNRHEVSNFIKKKRKQARDHCRRNREV